MTQSPNSETKRLIVGISGASGAIYAERTLVALAAASHQVEIVPSKVGSEIFRQERGRPLADFVGELITSGARMRVWDDMDYYAPFSSGSQLYDGMVIVPCSGGALGRIAHGTSTDLVARAADVCLKENRPLVLVVREAPFSEIHLRNMLIARRAGATILPAAPGFYSRPRDLVELADSLVQRILDHVGVEAAVFRRWRDGASELRPRVPSASPNPASEPPPRDPGSSTPMSEPQLRDPGSSTPKSEPQLRDPGSSTPMSEPPSRTPSAAPRSRS